MGVSNPTGDVFLPEMIGRKLHLQVPQCVFHTKVIGIWRTSTALPFISFIFASLDPVSFVNYNYQH